MSRQWRKSDVGKCPKCSLIIYASTMAGFDEDAPRCPICLTVKLEKVNNEQDNSGAEERVRT